MNQCELDCRSGSHYFCSLFKKINGMNVKKDVVYYEAPAMECIEMACEGVLCGSSLKPGESEDGILGDDL